MIRPKRNPIALLFCLLFVTAGCTSVTVHLNGVAPYTPTPPSPHFTTPEDAIALYLEGLAENNIDKVLAASAVAEMSDNFDFGRQVDRLRAMILTTSPAPADYAFYVTINRAQLTAQLLNQIKLFTFALLSSTEINGQPLLNVPPEQVDQFIQAVDPRRLATLELIKVVPPSAALMASDRYQENSQKAAAVYGADEMTERVALLHFEDAYYLIGFTLLRFSDQWKISSQSSPLANTSGLGTPVLMTPEEFEGSFP